MRQKLSLAECYETLELKPGAMLDDVRVAFRQLSKKWHPDQHQPDSEAHKKSLEKQIRINQAYEQLVAEILANGPAVVSKDAPRRPAHQRAAGVSDWCVEEEGEPSPGLQKAEFMHLLDKAKAGDPQAQFITGLCIETGSSGQSQDHAGAAWWYDRAVKQGNYDAMVRLGLLHLYGRGVRQDRNRTRELLTKAALSGHPEAMYQLGLFLSVIMNQEEQAIQWYKKAAAKGHSRAGRMIDTLDGLLR